MSLTSLFHWSTIWANMLEMALKIVDWISVTYRGDSIIRRDVTSKWEILAKDSLAINSPRVYPAMQTRQAMWYTADRVPCFWVCLSSIFNVALFRGAARPVDWLVV